MSDENKNPAEGELQPGEKRETTVEKTTPGQPEKQEVDRKVEHGPEPKAE